MGEDIIVKDFRSISWYELYNCILSWRGSLNGTSFSVPCRACVVFNDHLYTFGGQEGDFMAKPGSPVFKCSRRNEVISFLQLHIKSSQWNEISS